MYCSTCGVAVTQALSYCNFCGARLNGSKSDSAGKSPAVKPELLVSAMAGVFILGLVAITMLMGMLKSVLDLPVERVLAIALLPFLLMLLLEGLFMRLLWRRTKGMSEPNDKALAKRQATNELDAAQARALPEPMPSVTEHTTRAFDSAYIERTSK